MVIISPAYLYNDAVSPHQELSTLALRLAPAFHTTGTVFLGQRTLETSPKCYCLKSLKKPALHSENYFINNKRRKKIVNSL